MAKWREKNRDKLAANYKRWRTKNPDYAQKRGLKIKIEVFMAYGGVRCACPNCPCPEPGPEFLSIDHINGDGAAHRQTLNSSGRRGGRVVYQDLKRRGWPPGFQVLCHNCNVAKGTKKFCPHVSTDGKESEPCSEMKQS